MTIDVEVQTSVGLVEILCDYRVIPISRPVDIARALRSFGLGLSDAHKALNRIVADETVVLTLHGPDRTVIIACLAELGIAAR